MAMGTEVITYEVPLPMQDAALVLGALAAVAFLAHVATS